MKFLELRLLCGLGAAFASLIAKSLILNDLRFLRLSLQKKLSHCFIRARFRGFQGIYKYIPKQGALRPLCGIGIVLLAGCSFHSPCEPVGSLQCIHKDRMRQCVTDSNNACRAYWTAYEEARHSQVVKPDWRNQCHPAAVSACREALRGWSR